MDLEATLRIEYKHGIGDINEQEHHMDRLGMLQSLFWHRPRPALQDHSLPGESRVVVGRCRSCLMKAGGRSLPPKMVKRKGTYLDLMMHYYHSSRKTHSFLMLMGTCRTIVSVNIEDS